MTFLDLAVRYVRWRFAATAIAIASVAGVSAAMAPLLSLPAGLRDGLDDLPGRFPIVVGRGDGDDRVVLATLFLEPPAPPAMEPAIVERVRQHPGVQQVITLRMDAAPDPSVLRVRTTRDLFEALSGRVELESGRFFVPDAEDEVVAGASATAPPGDRLVGRLRATGTRTDDVLFSPWRVTDAPSALLVIPGRGFDPAVLQQALGADVRVVSTRASVERLARLLGAVDRVVSVLAAPLAIALACSLGLAFYGAGVERRRELAVLRAIGATPGFVCGLLFTEAAIVALAGIAAGVVTAALLVAAATAAMRTSGVPFRPDVGASVPLVAAIVFGVVQVAGGLVPALQAYRIDPARGLGEAYRPWKEMIGARGRERLAWIRLLFVFVLAFLVPTAMHRPTPPHEPLDPASRAFFERLRENGQDTVFLSTLDGSTVRVSGYIDVPPGSATTWRTRFDLVEHDPNQPPELLHAAPLPSPRERIAVHSAVAVEPTRYPVRVEGMFRVTGDARSPYAITDATVRVLAPE